MQFFVNYIPFGIDYLLVILGFFNTDFSIFFFAFKFKFQIQQADFRVFEILGLLFEPSVGESLFEGNSVHDNRFLS